MSAVVRRAVGRAVLAALVVVGMLGLSADASHAAQVVENNYAATGSWSSTTFVGVVDPANPTPWDDSYTIFYPTTIGAGGYDHPIVVWGNGGAQNPMVYETLLRHFASWGYVVVAPNSGYVGPTRLLAARQYMITQNSRPGTFQGRLDVNTVGIVGHSAGAQHALDAVLDGPGLFDSATAISTPDPEWWNLCPTPEWPFPPPPGEPPCESINPTAFLQQMQGFSAPLFLPRGNLATDDWIASDTWHIQLQSAKPGMSAKGSLIACGHFSCTSPLGAGTAWRARGYTTAWLEYTLKGDTFARTAFAGPTAEIFTNAAWTNEAVKNPI